MARNTPARIERVIEEVDNPRDFVMARLAAARAAAAAVVGALDDAIGAFVNPDSDKKGKERTALVSDALESAGVVSRALESAEAAMEDLEAADWQAPEPWEDDEDDDEDDEDDDEDEGDEDDDDDGD